jgi:hypothetical protein
VPPCCGDEGALVALTSHATGSYTGAFTKHVGTCLMHRFSVLGYNAVRQGMHPHLPTELLKKKKIDMDGLGIEEGTRLLQPVRAPRLRLLAWGLRRTLTLHPWSCRTYRYL